MSHHLEGSRNSCALHGALQVLEAIEGVVPIIHSTAGCGVQHYLGNTRTGPGIDSFGSPPVSSSNISEKHVVFGGGSRLREQLKNTIKVVEGELYAIVSGCPTEMVGDDIPAMAKEGLEQGFPVIYANTAGFRGDVHLGYQLAVRSLIEQLPDPTAALEPVQPGLVNILGVVPRQEPFWLGNLEEIGRMLEGIGLVPNLLFGPGQGVEAWKRVPRAAFNLVLSPWGEAPAKLLEERYGTSWLALEGVPVGDAAGRLLETLTESLGLDPARTAGFRGREEGRLNRYLAGLADTYHRAGFQREFALVGESAQVAGVAEFLTATLGLLPRLLIVTDHPEQQARERLAGHLGALLAGYRTEVADLLGESGVGLLLGSHLERQVAKRLRVPFLPVSFPLSRQVVLSRSYAGYRGAITLLEDLGSAILAGSA